MIKIIFCVAVLLSVSAHAMDMTDCRNYSDGSTLCTHYTDKDMSILGGLNHEKQLNDPDLRVGPLPPPWHKTPNGDWVNN